MSFESAGESDPDEIPFSSLIALDEIDMLSDQTKNGTNLDKTKTSVKGTLTFDHSKFANLCNRDEIQAFKITTDYFTSVTPQNSYQYGLPTLFFNYGVQSVVIPSGKHDMHAQLNDAFFEFNGNCGYVLKPSDMSVVNFFDKIMQF